MVDRTQVTRTAVLDVDDRRTYKLTPEEVYTQCLTKDKIEREGEVTSWHGGSGSKGMAHLDPW